MLQRESETTNKKLDIITNKLSKLDTIETNLSEMDKSIKSLKGCVQKVENKSHESNSR